MASRIRIQAQEQSRGQKLPLVCLGRTLLRSRGLCQFLIWQLLSRYQFQERIAEQKLILAVVKAMFQFKIDKELAVARQRIL